MISHRKTWLRIAKLGDLPADIAPDVLRHSFASLAADLGYNEADHSLPAQPQHAQHHPQVRAFRRCRIAGAADPVANAPMKLMAEKPNLTPN